MNAELRFYFGTMGSMKSATVLMVNHSLRVDKKLSVYLLKSAIDTRGGTNIIESRNGNSTEADAIIDKDANIMEVLQGLGFSNGNKPHIILIDECQFLTASQIETIREIVSLYDVPIYCYGLSTDANTHLFEGSKRLFELADLRLEFETFCECGGKATINARVDQFGNVIKPETQIDIGGDEKYKPMCHKCWVLRGGKF